MKTILINEKDLLSLKSDAMRMKKIYNRRIRTINAILKTIMYFFMALTVFSLMMIAVTNDRLYTGSLNPIYFCISMLVSMIISLIAIFLSEQFKKITTR